MPELNIGEHMFQLKTFTLANSSAQVLRDTAAQLFALFLEREAEFGVHPSVVIDYPNLADTSSTGFLADAARYVARRAQAVEPSPSQPRVVILTTYADIVGPNLVAAGYECVHIDMPAGPDHTAAFTLGPVDHGPTGRTLYIEAVNEQDDKIKPSFALLLKGTSGQVVGGACGSIHERSGKRFAYLATLTLAATMPAGSGTELVEQLVQFLRSQGVATIHLGTQTAASFYEKQGFKVDHRLVRKLRVRQKGGQTLMSDLVILSRDI